MKTFLASFGKWLGTVFSAAVVGSVAGSVMTFVISDYQDSRSKLRDAQYAQMDKIREGQSEAIKKFFTDQDDTIRASARTYIDRVIENMNKPAQSKSQAKAAEELGNQIAKRSSQAESLKAIFPAASAKTEIEDYQKSLLDFLDTIEGFKTPLQMKDWSEKYGKMEKAQAALRDRLKDIAEKKPEAPTTRVPLF